jgi:hypothetical protein
MLNNEQNWPHSTTAADGSGGQPGGRPFVPPTLSGRYVSLRAVSPGDYPFLQQAELTADLSARWRFRGTTPSPEQWGQSLWGQVLVQFLVIHNEAEPPVGIVCVFQPDFQSSHAGLAAARLSGPTHSPLMMMGVELFVDYVFAYWSFRKLYMEMPEYNYEPIRSGEGQRFRLEARLKDYYYLAGEYWDQLTLSIDSEDWKQGREARSRIPDAVPVRSVRVRRAAPSERRR